MKKKVISILMCLCLVITLPPTGVLATESEPSNDVLLTATNYPIWIGDTQFTSENLTLDSDDNSSITEGSATYDPAAGTLTLNEFTYSGAAHYDSTYNFYGALYSGRSLTIILTGDNSITLTPSTGGRSGGICMSSANLTIQGEGSLTVQGGETSSDRSYGIYAGNITVNSGTITVTGGKSGSYEGAGICANSGDFTLNGGSVTTTCGEYDNTTSSGYGIKVAGSSNRIKINGGGLTAAGYSGADNSYAMSKTPTYGTYCTPTVKAGVSSGDATETESPEYNTSKYINITTVGLDPHNHPICGANCAHTDTHSDVTWLPLDTTGGTLAAGNYYLVDNVTLSSILGINTGTVNLCLNGKTLTRSGKVINVANGATLNLCDCGTGGKVEYTGYDVCIVNYGTLNVRGSVSINSTKEYGVMNYGALNLSGTPTISGGDRYADICCANYGSYNTILNANDGTTSPAHYSGEALTVDFYSYVLGTAAICGVNDTNKELFTLKNANYYLANGTGDNAGNLIIRGVSKNLSWYDEDGTIALSGDSYPTAAEYGASIAVAPPVKGGYIPVGWLYSTDSGSTWEDSVWNASNTLNADIDFKALYVPAFSGGSGTEASPYEISTAEQLRGLDTLVNNGSTEYNASTVYYKLTAENLDLSALCGSSVGSGGTSWTPIGTYENEFNAHFDGGGKTIVELYINNSDDYQGLFGYIYDGTVKDLTMTGVSITAGNYVGGVAGYISGSSAVVIGCTVAGEVSGYRGVGTIAGYKDASTEVSDNNDVGCTVTVLPPSGYTTDSNAIMAYKINSYGFDIRGFYNNEWIKTEFSDSYDIECEGLTGYGDVRATANFINDGRYVQVNFTVTAPSSGITNGKLAVVADTQIGSNDYATIEVIKNGSEEVVGLKMVDDISRNSSYEAQFNLYFADAGGVTDVDTYWFGAHSGENTNCFNQLNTSNISNGGTYTSEGDTYTQFSGADSGIAFSWQDINLAAGASKTYSMIIGIGEKSDPPQWSGDAEASPISLTQDAGQTEPTESAVNVNASVAHVEGQSHSLYYDVDGGESWKIGNFTPGTDTAPDTILESISLGDLEEGDHTLRFWVVNSSGASTPAVTKKITIDGSGVITSGLDSGDVTIGPDAPEFENTIEVDNSSGANFYFTTPYSEMPMVKAYTSADGDMLTEASVSSQTYGISVNNITTRTELWICVVVNGVESARTKITVLPQYTPVSGSEFGNGEDFVNATGAAGLADYLNYCEPGCASISGNTVTLLKEATLFHYLTLKMPEITLNLNGKTLHGFTGTGTTLTIGEGTETAIIRNGAIATGSVCVISHAAGSLTLSDVDITGAVQGVVTGRNMTLTDGSTITIVAADVSGIENLEDSMALCVTGGENVQFVSATIINNNIGTGHYTYYGFDPNESPVPPTLADCIDTGSETTASSQLISGVEVCSDTITITISDPDAPPAWITSAIANPDDYEYIGTSPKTLKLLDDIILEGSLVPTEDVTIDLNGHTITGAEGQDAITATDYAEITITDTSTGVKGKIIGGSGADGIIGESGGDAITGSNVTVTNGASVVGGNGGSGNSGSGGNGGHGIDTTGTVTIGSGSNVVGGNGGSGTTVGGNGGSGVNTTNGQIIIDTGAIVSGGSGGSGIGDGAGGSGGIGANTGVASEGAVNVNGAVTGGNGGAGGENNNADADGGTGGAGVCTGTTTEITVTGTGSITGGNGGNVPSGNTLGDVGEAGATVTGGNVADGVTVTQGNSGIRVNVTIISPDGAQEIKVPTDSVAQAAVTGEELEEAQATSKTITVNLTVGPSSGESSGKTAIENAITSENITIIFIEVKLEKVVTEVGGSEQRTTITEANSLIPFEIVLSSASRGKDHYAVLRQHGNRVDSLTETPNRDGEYISINAEKTVITVYAKNFSTYAIAYSDEPITSVTQDNSSSHGSGGSSTVIATIPVITTPENGKVTISPANPTVGSTVTISTVSKEGYEVDSVEALADGGKTIAVTNAGNGKYTFKQPNQKVTVTVTFKLKTDMSFNDVRPANWFYDDVKYVYEKKLMTGVTKELFDPSADTIRGMIVTILWRMEGEPVAVANMSFKDVSKAQYYYEAVAWAAENEIVQGFSREVYGPKQTITREQLSAILYRYAEYKGYDVSDKADLSKFRDENKISNYAVPTMSWANAEGLINGKEGNILDPKNKATRAELAAIFHRFIAKYQS